MANFELDEEQVEAIFLALKGERNLDTLLKLKDKLEVQQLHAGVREVDEQLRVLQGTGIQQPGLLRLFNPQHDALADAGQEAAHQAAVSTKKPRGKKKQAGGEDATGVIPFPTAETPEGPQDGPQWADGTPSPRPAKGQRVVWPSGEALELVDVLGYDPEANGFRVVATNGWDGMVYSYGQREAQEWRVLTMALQYADENSPEKEPLGETEGALAEARRLAHQLEHLGSSGEMSVPDLVAEFRTRAADLLRYTLWLTPTDLHEAVRDGFARTANLETPAERPRVLARAVLFNLEELHGPEEVVVLEVVPPLTDAQERTVLSTLGYPVDGQGVSSAELEAGGVNLAVDPEAGYDGSTFEQQEAMLAQGEVPEGASSGDGQLAGVAQLEEVAREEPPEAGRRGGRGGRRKKAKE